MNASGLEFDPLSLSFADSRRTAVRDVHSVLVDCLHEAGRGKVWLAYSPARHFGITKK